jgi:YHS domain-containing protein
MLKRHEGHESRLEGKTSVKERTMIRDPACRRLVTNETAQAVAEYKGQRYLFCSRGCKMAFQREPEACLTGTGLEKSTAPREMGRWVCRR